MLYRSLGALADLLGPIRELATVTTIVEVRAPLKAGAILTAHFMNLQKLTKSQRAKPQDDLQRFIMGGEQRPAAGAAVGLSTLMPAADELVALQRDVLVLLAGAVEAVESARQQRGGARHHRPHDQTRVRR